MCGMCGMCGMCVAGVLVLRRVLVLPRQLREYSCSRVLVVAAGIGGSNTAQAFPETTLLRERESERARERESERERERERENQDSGGDPRDDAHQHTHPRRTCFTHTHTRLGFRVYAP
jgi:hypothetical protein